MTELRHLGSNGGTGERVMRNRSAGLTDVLIKYIPVADVGVGTQLAGMREFRPKPGGGAGEVVEVPAGPQVVVVGPPSVTGIWNLNTGGTLDLRNIAGLPLGAGFFVLVGEITQAEAEAIIGGPLPP